MIKQVVGNKSSLLLKNILQNAQTLELFTVNIKTESIQKVIKNANLVAQLEEHGGSFRGGGEAHLLNVKVAEFS